MTGPARISFFFLLVLQSNSLAQIYPFKHYTTTDGLVQATVEKIFQDSRGFLWFGTRGGVSRYDGTEFRSFLSHGTPKSDVKWIWEDNEHTLWFITYGNGIAKLAHEDSSFSWMKSNAGLLPDDFVNVLFKDSRERKWIGTENGLLVLNPDGSSARFDTRTGLPFAAIRSIVEDRDGFMWLGTIGGLVRVNPEIANGLTAAVVMDRPTRYLLVMRKGELLAATSSGPGDRKGGVFRIHRSSLDTLVSYSKIHEEFKGMTACEDSRGRVWVGSSQGVWLFDDHVLRRIRGANGLQNEYIYDIVEDREGTIWIGTENGVSKLPARAVVSYSVSRGSSSDVTLAMYQDSRRHLWFGTYHGLAMLDPDGKMVRLSREDGLLDPLVNAIADGGHGDVWIGTRGGVNILSKGKLVAKDIPELGPRRSVASVAKDANGSMWLGCYDRIVVCSRDGNTRVIDSTAGIPRGPVRSLAFDNDGTPWFATDYSGAAYYRENRVHLYSETDGLPDNRVHCVYHDRLGRTWFATHRGIAFLEDGRVRRLANSEWNLEDSPVYFVLQDSAQQMWFGTDYGVFSLSGGRLQHLNTHDGLAADIVERALVDHDGNVWFGTHGGVSRVDRVRVKQEIPIPSVYLALVTAGDNERPFSSGSLIEYEERTVAFRYNALSYVDETSMLFQWKLEGFDADWQAPQRQRQVRYTNLNPGQYTFAVRAANRNGSWSLPARFVMAIAPPFWQTWWFILVVVAVVVSVLSVAYRYRVRQLLNVERMRTRIAADLHDDIASSLSSVALYSDVIQRELQDAPEEVRMLLHRIRDISREVMESIGLIVWAVDPRRDELAQVFHYFQRHATQLCSAAGIEFACHLQEGIEAVRLTPDHRRTIFLIFKEALNNTVRHSGCSRVEFACTMNDHVLEIALNDNGRGFRLDGDIHGHGLQSMRARAAGIGAEIEINSQPGHGTALRARVRMA